MLIGMPRLQRSAYDRSPPGPRGRPSCRSRVAVRGGRGMTSTTYEAGREIAGYRIESLIGRGGMAVVYRAEDMRLGRKVALKLLVAAARRQRTVPPALHPGITAGGVAGPPEHRPDLRGRRGRRAAVHRDAVRHRLRPEGPARRAGRPAAPGLDAAAVRPDRGRAGLRPRGRARAPGRQAREHPRRRRRSTRGTITASTSISRTSGSPSAPPSCPAGLTGTGHFLGTVDYVSPGADPGQAGGAGHRHLRAGLRALRVPDRAAPLPPGRRRRPAVGAPVRDAPARHRDPPRGPRGRQRRGGPGHGEGARATGTSRARSSCASSRRPSTSRRRPRHCRGRRRQPRGPWPGAVGDTGSHRGPGEHAHLQPSQWGGRSATASRSTSGPASSPPRSPTTAASRCSRSAMAPSWRPPSSTSGDDGRVVTGEAAARRAVSHPDRGRPGDQAEPGQSHPGHARWRAVRGELTCWARCCRTSWPG